MNFNNKTALVTGAAVGIGRAVAHKMASLGAKLVLVDVNFEKLQTVKLELEQYTNNVLIYECDITDEEKVNEIINESQKEFGGIDILINNAAVWRSFKPFTEISSEEWKQYLDINIMGVVNFTKAVLPVMIEKRYGRIINVSSVAGVYGIANMVHYSATKGAVISMTKALAKEVAEKGITVNAVSPGTVSDSSNPDMDSYIENDMSYIGRTGTNNENADLICFLASDQASYISGENIQIDGCRRRI